MVNKWGDKFKNKGKETRISWRISWNWFYVIFWMPKVALATALDGIAVKLVLNFASWNSELTQSFDRWVNTKRQVEKYLKWQFKKRWRDHTVIYKYRQSITANRYEQKNAKWKLLVDFKTFISIFNYWLLAQIDIIQVVLAK